MDAKQRSENRVLTEKVLVSPSKYIPILYIIVCSRMKTIRTILQYRSMRYRSSISWHRDEGKLILKIKKCHLFIKILIPKDESARPACLNWIPLFVSTTFPADWLKVRSGRMRRVPKLISSPGSSIMGRSSAPSWIPYNLHQILPEEAMM